LAVVEQRIKAYVTALLEHGILVAIGSDTRMDTSVQEVEYLRSLGVADDLTLLKAWTETRARTVFPDRRIGAWRAFDR
jgi:hypothetical protein